MRITAEVRACECRIGERQASRESAKYDRRRCEGYTLAYLANLLSLISPPAPASLPINACGVL